jgi:hypothetical protein
LGQAEFYESEGEVNTPFDLSELLTRINATPSNIAKKGKFTLLTEYFRQRSEVVFTLTFGDIEKILGQPLCDSAHKFID